MSIIATAVRHLMAAGVTGDALIAAIEDMEAQVRAEPKARSVGAIRQQRYRENQRNEASQTVTSDACDAPVSLSLPPNENISNPPTHTHPENITRARKAHALPVDWEPMLTAKAQQTVDGWPPGKLDQELAAFRDHASDKGRTSKDWQAAFRTWISNTNRWKTNNGNTPRNDDGPKNPYVRAVIANQAARAADQRGKPGGWTEHSEAAF